MKAIILAAGYATRLYPLTLNKPKALLDVGGKAIIDHICEEIETINTIDEIFVVTNDKFYKDFINWEKTKTSIKRIKIINDGTSSDETKLGAIGDIKLIINSENIDDDLMIIAGDNLFTYKLKDFYNYFEAVQGDCVCVQELDDLNELRRVAVAQLDDNNRVLQLEEKPQEPKSNIAVYASYIYRRDTLPLFNTYIAEGNNPDAPGHFPAWLYKRKPLYAFVFDGECYDIGTHESYNFVRKLYDRVG